MLQANKQITENAAYQINININIIIIINIYIFRIAIYFIYIFKHTTNVSTQKVLF